MPKRRANIANLNRQNIETNKEKEEDLALHAAQLIKAIMDQLKDMDNASLNTYKDQVSELFKYVISSHPR